MTTDFGDLNVPSRLLLGPGPSIVHPRVYRAMMTPVIGYRHPFALSLSKGFVGRGGRRASTSSARTDSGGEQAGAPAAGIGRQAR